MAVPEGAELQNVLPETSGIAVQATPEEAGAGIGRGLEKAGQGLTQTGKFYDQVAADQATNNWQQRTNAILHGDSRKTVQLPDGTSAPDTGFYGLRGQAAMEAWPKVAEQLDEITKEERSGLWSTQAQEQFDTDTRRYRFNMDAEIGSHADNQQKTWMTSVNRTTAELGLNALAQDPNNPRTEAKAYNDTLKSYIRQAQIDGTDPTAAILKAQQDVALTKLRSQLVSDPAAAQKTIETSKTLASLPDYPQLAAEVRSRVDQSQIGPLSDAIVDQARRDASAGARPGGPPNPNNIGNVKTVTGAFAQPATPMDGVVLAASLLRSRYRGLTIEQIAQGWAPAKDGNNPAAWAANVSRATGLKTDTVPDLNDPKILAALIRGIGVAEKKPDGLVVFGPQAINAGVKAALVGQIPRMAAASQADGTRAPPMSLANYYREHSAEILDGARARAEAQFPRNPDAVDRTIERVSRGINQVISQQEQQYKVDTDTVQQAMDGTFSKGQRPQSVDQLVSLGPQVAAAWESLQSNNPIVANRIENVFDAIARGKAVGYGAAFNGYFSRALAPDGDPARISDPTALWPVVGGPDSALTTNGLAALSRVISARNTPQGEADATQMRLFFQYAHAQISNANPAMHMDDPAGEKNYQKFIGLSLPVIEQARLSGKPIAALFNPKSPDYLGNFVGNFKRSTTQMILDTMGAYQPPPVTTVDVTTIKTPDELRTAFKNGQITRPDGNKLAQERGWWTPQEVPPPVPTVH